ncbi:DUF1648 domain-containing protein [Lysinibacillus sp. LZ02]|uniref:DUF1648 domain-containing protein n=1 Tax=Lysinibacillus sp. LZ02 TaxID=3420668 RepID=UPI003D36146F
MLPERPKLHIEKTGIEKFANIIGLASILAMILFIIFNWNALPGTVPTHFNGAGEADAWGSKFSLLILPAIAIVLHLFMGIVERKPHAHNYPARLTEENAPQFYIESRKIVNLTKNVCTVMFAYIVIRSILVALGEADGLGILGMVIFFMVLAIVIIRGMVRMSKIK